MNRSTFSLVLLVCCAHALVHTYELSLPSVEQELASEFHPDDPKAGKQLSGSLSNTWRLFWGLGALLAGFLVDRLGAARMLTTYLVGCSILCVATGFSSELIMLVTVMLMMGVFASIYHPAGLDLISSVTDAESRPRALGLHGIFGSTGIALAPFVAWALLSIGFSWRQYYLAVAVPGLIVAAFLWWKTSMRKSNENRVKLKRNAELDDDGNQHWRAFWILTAIAVLQGFVYSGQMSFLPRYLSSYSGAEAAAATSSVTLQSKLLASGALMLGCIGQYLAGRFARVDRLEKQIMWITFANVPCLIAMAYATGWFRFAAAGLFCVVHFMHQPIYNSLIPKYAPVRQRSFCFGISFAMGMTFGSFGAGFAGRLLDEVPIFFTLAGISAAAGLIGVFLIVVEGKNSVLKNPASPRNDSL